MSTDQGAANEQPFLKRKAQTFISQLQTLQTNIIEGSLQSLDQVDLTMNMELIERILDKFEDTQGKLEEQHPDELDSDARDQFISKYMWIKATITRELQSQRFEGHPHSSTQNYAPPDTQSMVVFKQQKSCLPELKLPTFGGAYSDWPHFISMFQTVIGREPDLTNLEKLQHLRSCLKDVALDTIKALDISEPNYEKALELLHNRFNNKRLIFQAHIRELFGSRSANAAGAANLRKLIDNFTSHIRALQTLGTKEQLNDCLLIHIMLQKLDPATQTKWEERWSSNDLPTWENMTAFLDKRCQTLENLQYTTAETHDTQVSKNMYRKKSLVISNPPKGVCSYCKSPNHLIYSCSSFANLSPSARWKEAKGAELCLNCLKPGHKLQQCKSSQCRRCTAMHHTLLHRDLNEQQKHIESRQTSGPTSLVSKTNSNTALALPDNRLNECVLLATAIILVKNKAGSFIPCRAILDSASQLNFITTRFVNQLQLKKSKCSMSISGIGESGLMVEHTADVTFQSMHSDFTTMITAAVTRTITDQQPNFTFNASHWDIPKNIKLADPSFNKAQRIDMLIGAEIFFDLLCVGQIRLNQGPHILQKTRLGWVVSGGKHNSTQHSSLVATRATSDSLESYELLDKAVRNFWEIDYSTESISRTTKEEIDCEAHFKNNYYRLPTGEYSVRLPVKLSVNLLGDSYQQALRRFLSLERRLQRNIVVKQQYSAFLSEYLELGHMSRIERPLPSVPTYFLPHHCVFKGDSTTTKLRVVFDGSAATSTGHSLNEILMAGPTIQPKLADILIRFRFQPVALTGDICKMYRCVRVTAPDDYLQCILWREDQHHDISLFKLETVTYGTRPASFLAIRAMQQLAKDEIESHPLGSQIILRDFYVDDMITGSDSVEGAIQIMQQTTQLLAKGNFKIRKWCSSDPAVLSNVPSADRETLLKFDDGSVITKTLGLQWSPESDTFLFSFNPSHSPSSITKRSILSTIARFYDPLGLIGPFICKAKILLQRLWAEKLDWDESLPICYQTMWQQLYNQFDAIKHLSFPRFVSKRNTVIQLHAFCDASLSAYGTCIYIRTSTENNVCANLLCSKSRVAPLKSLTVPKLELCAADLLAQVVHSIMQLNILDCAIFCWSDSNIVLSWLKEEPSKFNIFVANRISRIQHLTKGMEWRHVPTISNPADILSRGATPNELINSSSWNHGPSFLLRPQSEWPNYHIHADMPERRKNVLFSLSSTVDTSVNYKYINSFKTMQRIFGYVHMFVKKDHSGQLTPSNIQHGTYILIRMVQLVHFASEYKTLRRGQPINSSSSLAALSPFIDEHGLLRVGGRLKNAALDFATRHPIILPKRHPLTVSIINHFHKACLHAGPQALLATIRLQYWPIGGRKTVAHVINKCIRCFRARPKLIEEVMADLPTERVQATRTFFTTGVDFCGPFYYQSEVRNRPPVKCYICLFICFATKAVHLELVKDLSTLAFLAALQRFIYTRGKPKTLWSDNATNFVGSKNELMELKRLFLSSEHQQMVHNQCLDIGIEWRFIPPRSPHFGGLWEAAIKSAKFHFYRVLGSSVASFEELRTLVCQIAAIINSRPLIRLTEHPDDLDVLTPAHFLIGGPFTGIVEPNITDLNVNRLGRWQRIAYMQQLFWKRWSTEYLTQLQQRSKWRSSNCSLSTGALVLIKDENMPPLRWPLARVTSLIPGSDGISRVAVLKTNAGVVRRAVAKLCLLPLEDSIESAAFQRGEDVGSPCIN